MRKVPGKCVQGLKKDLRQRDQRGLFQHIKVLNMEGTRKDSLQYIRDEEGRMLRDPGLILEKWARFFGSLLNKLRLEIIEGLPQWSATDDLGIESTGNELIAALRSMANGRAVGADELQVELLKLGLNHDPTMFRKSLG